MSRGHNRHKGFSQTSKRFDGELKAQHQRSHSTQHSAETAKAVLEDKTSKEMPSAKETQSL